MKPRWPQFSLRDLAWAVLLICVVLVYSQNNSQQRRKHRDQLQLARERHRESLEIVKRQLTKRLEDQGKELRAAESRARNAEQLAAPNLSQASSNPDAP